MVYAGLAVAACFWSTLGLHASQQLWIILAYNGIKLWAPLQCNPNYFKEWQAELQALQLVERIK